MRSNKLSRIIAALVCTVMVLVISLGTGHSSVWADPSYQIDDNSGGVNVSYTNTQGYSKATVDVFITPNCECDMSKLVTAYGSWGGGEVTVNSSESDESHVALTLTVVLTGSDKYTGLWFNASVACEVSHGTPVFTKASSATPTPVPAAPATTTQNTTQAPQPAATTAQNANSGSTNNNGGSANNGDSGNNSGNNANANSGTGTQASVVAGATSTTRHTTATTANTDEPTEASTETANTMSTDATDAEGNGLVIVGEVEEGESYEETSVLEETHADGSHVVVGLVGATSAGQEKSSIFSWLWLIILILLGGAAYFRYRQLKNKNMGGKEMALNFVPGVAGLVYTISNIGPTNHTIASDAAATQTFNTASAMKELRQMKEANDKADAVQAAKTNPSSTAHAPIKRPKELSVNHAAQTTAKATEEVKASAPVAKSVPVARDIPVRPTVNTTPAVNPAPVARTMPVQPAVKPVATAATAANSAAAIAAKERAEAAREQQAMRQAMQDAAKAKKEEQARQEVKQHAPIKRPKELSVNRSAATSESECLPTQASATATAFANQAARTSSASSTASSGRAPVWAGHGTNINPFASASAATEQKEAVRALNVAETNNERAEAEQRRSIAEQKTHKSAFFDRSSQTRATTGTADVESVYGGIVRPSAIVDGERDISRTRTAPAMGAALEGRRPAIMNGNVQVTPTTKPLSGANSPED